MYKCNCGLTRSNASELHAHIRSFKGKDLAHFLVTQSRRPGLRSSAPPPSTSSSDPGPTVSSSDGTGCQYHLQLSVSAFRSSNRLATDAPYLTSVCLC